MPFNYWSAESEAIMKHTLFPQLSNKEFHKPFEGMCIQIIATDTSTTLEQVIEAAEAFYDVSGRIGLAVTG